MSRLALCLFGLLLLAPDLALASGALRRFALVVGANDGGRGRTELRYAASDATAVARVLEELGGVHEGDRLLLVEPGRADLQRGLAELQTRLAAARAPDTRVELFVYYSGHSDEEGLLLGDERFGYGELRDALESLPADVRVAILDSCSSGALTRRKGGTRRAPFLVDAASRVKGHAYLTSSSADEAAQESDRIGASFFTHFLVSGLRGAADSTRDGKVTLTEAYQFAFAETLARTEKTSSGAQHPAYEMQLVGTGDLVMTDLRSTAAGLVVDDAISGRIYVRDERGTLVVELRKAEMTPVELGLAAGTYVVTVEQKGAVSEAQVQLAEGSRSLLRAGQLRPVTPEQNRARGGFAEEADDYVHAPFVFGVAPGLSTLPGNTSADRVITGVGLNLLGGKTARLDGAEFGFGLNWHTEEAAGAMFALGGNLTGGDMRGAALAVGFNHAGGSLSGLQAAVGYNGAAGDVHLGQLAVGGNWAGGSVSGVQSAVGFNAAGGEVVGVQSTVGGNWADARVRGGQLAVGLNVARAEVKGLQAAVGASWTAGELTGYQGTAGLSVVEGRLSGVQNGAVNVAAQGGNALQAGVANWSSEPLAGAQIAAGFSWARELSGAQIGVVNVGGQVEGAQIGVVNVASGEVRGAQIGVFNYAEDADAPIGVLSIVRNGRFNLDAWADETNVANLGLKIGAKHLYGIFTLGAGGQLRFDRDQRWSTGLGLGSHIGVVSDLLSFVNLELITRQVHFGDGWSGDEDDLMLISTLRLGAGWQLLPRLALVAGPTLNTSVATPEMDERVDPGLFGRSADLGGGRDVQVRMWPGFFVGLQI